MIESNQPRPSTNQKSKTKLLLIILLPISTVVLFLIIFLPVWFSCKQDPQPEKETPAPLSIFSCNDQNEIVGFNEEVLQNYNIGTKNMLSEYNTIDLSNQVIANNCDFSNELSRQVFIEWTQLKHLNLSKTKWQPNETFASTGYHTFSLVNFPSLETIDLSEADFASISINSKPWIYSARETFAYMVCPHLKKINLSQTIFAGSNMSTNGVWTANETFANINFASLTDLLLDGTIFASPDMLKANGSTSPGEMRIAGKTFNNSTFAHLTTLDLSSAKWCDDNIAEGRFGKQLEIWGSFETFSYVKFDALTNLNFSTTVFSNFCGNYADKYFSFLPGLETFKRIQADRLRTINLSAIALYNFSDEFHEGNFIYQSFFDSIQTTVTPTDKMHIIDTTNYWGTNTHATDTLNSWFTTNNWWVN